MRLEAKTFGYFSTRGDQEILNLVLSLPMLQKVLLMGFLLLIPITGWVQTIEPRLQAQRDQQGILAPSKAGPETPTNSGTSGNRTLLSSINRIAGDQRRFWSAPKDLRRPSALEGFLPFVGITALAVAGDASLARHISGTKSQTSLSNYATLALAGGAGSTYLLGKVTRNDHLRETGFLAGEAALNGALITFALQSAALRQRPYAGNGSGQFFTRGNSFPSQHAAFAWSVASIAAHEYPGPMTKLIAYGLATSISVTRVTGKQHFPSDVLVGSALGWYLGRQIYRAHHNSELGGESWGEVRESDEGEPEKKLRLPGKMGSAFLPLDSWVYRGVERLAAFGYIDRTFLGMKPWTRMECAQLLQQADEIFAEPGDARQEIVDLYRRLQAEFAYEIDLLNGTRDRNRVVALDSIYTRGLSISGPVLTDSYHLGQTLDDDFGRPFRRGTNVQAGGSFHASLGPAAVSFRAEFQHAPWAPPLSEPVRNFIAMRDDVPVPPAVPFPALNRVRLLDVYVAINVREGWQLSFGSQSHSWGPGPGSSLLWSNNIEPIPMLRLSQSASILPGILKVLGPARLESFIGRLEGHAYIPHPYIYGNKINFRPLPGLEIGFGRTVTIGGKGGTPLTTKNFVLSFFGQTSPQLDSVPGDSHSNFDWSFRVPKTRNYLVFYGELYADDDFVPFQNPPKNPFRPGIYLTRFPWLPKLDLHMEAASTQSSSAKLNFWNSTYRDGYTSNGNLIGNTVGRMGQTIQCWLNYWISSRNTIEFSIRHNMVSHDFIPGGAAWQDYTLRHDLESRSGVYLRSQLHFEHISSYSILFSSPQSNLTAAVEVGFVRLHSRR